MAEARPHTSATANCCRLGVARRMIWQKRRPLTGSAGCRRASYRLSRSRFALRTAIEIDEVAAGVVAPPHSDRLCCCSPPNTSTYHVAKSSWKNGGYSCLSPTQNNGLRHHHSLMLGRASSSSCPKAFSCWGSTPKRSFRLRGKAAAVISSLSESGRVAHHRAPGPLFFAVTGGSSTRVYGRLSIHTKFSGTANRSPPPPP